jgi:threonine dehydratase
MELPSPAGIEDALSIVRPHLPETPLLRVELLSRVLDADVWIKNETVTPIASFKIRGALTDLTRATAQSGVTNVVTSSTGNHGQAVAYAARLLGLGADIFLPAEANPVKAAMVRAFGATLHQVGRDNNEGKDAARTFAAERGYHFVDDGESLDVMEGAGTLGLEVGRGLEGVDTMFVPVGDAPLITGAGCGLKSVQPKARVIGVQAKGAPALTNSFHAGKAVEGPTDTIADGLSARIPAARAVAGICAFADDAMLVDDGALLAAIHALAESAHVLVEPAGAAGLAGAWTRRNEIVGQRVVLILTGANIATDTLRAALAAPPLFPLSAAAG